MVNKNKMMQWIEKSLGTDNFSIEDEGGSQKGDGYIGDVHFVKVIINDPKKNEKELHLVVKVSKTEPSLRPISSILCGTEVIFYSDVFPMMDKFQRGKNVKQNFNSIPKCYKTFIEENTETVVLENLKPRGYEMYYASQPMNVNHIKLVLKNYAKFHAISFALLDQQPGIFKEMENKFKHSLSSIVENCLKPFYDRIDTKSRVNYLIEAGRLDLAQKLGKEIEKGTYFNARNAVDVVPEERVVIHGDTHSQNFLFKYQDGNKENPLAVVLLDFQFSGVHSPMIDLGYFWYYVASKEEFSHFQQLMEFYYEELSSAANELGSDISKTFPISKMWNHWEKYSLYGFNQAVSFLDAFYAAEILDVANYVGDAKDEIAVKMTPENKSAYLKRLVAVTDHYFNFKIK